MGDNGITCLSGRGGPEAGGRVRNTGSACSASCRLALPARRDDPLSGCLAARTASSPTAPSPTTETVFPGPRRLRRRRTARCPRGRCQALQAARSIGRCRLEYLRHPRRPREPGLETCRWNAAAATQQGLYKVMRRACARALGRPAVNRNPSAATASREQRQTHVQAGLQESEVDRRSHKLFGGNPAM
jgi:hypothetical protein